MRIGLYPGTFDPITLGHMDIIRRAAALVDRLVIGVAINRDKGPMFSLEERVAMVEAETSPLAQAAGVEIIAHPFENLLIDCAHDVGAGVIIRGLRAVADFEYEYQMVGMNRQLDDSIETVFLMAANQIWTRFAGRKIFAARFGRPLVTAPICCLAHMANLPRLAPFDWPSGSKHSTRYGLKNRHRLTCPKPWPKWQAPPQFRSPLANGYAANMSFRASCNAGQRPFYSRILDALAVF